MIQSDHPDREKLTVEEAIQALKCELEDSDIDYEITAEHDPINKSFYFVLSCSADHQLWYDRDYFAGWEIGGVQYFPSGDSLNLNIRFVRERHEYADDYDGTGIFDSETVSLLCDECGRGIRTPMDVEIEERRSLCQTCAD